MSSPYLSQIEAFSFGYAPRGWLQCAGQILPINQNQALFALLGTNFGGNGTTNFQLPDLRARLALGVGQGTGLSPYAIGEQVGQETVTIAAVNMPTGSHTHSVNGNTATTSLSPMPGPTVVLSSGISQQGTVTSTENIYSTAAPSIAMGALAPTGGQPHTNVMPTLAINYCICVSGIFPSRN